MNFEDENSEKILNEIMNDAFWLGFLLEIKRKIKDYNQKEILANFLIFYCSIFCEEILKAKVGKLSGKSNIKESQIHDFRNHNLKYSPYLNSDFTDNIIREMGINFDNYEFDIVMTMNKKFLIDINFNNWELSKKENLDLLNGLVVTPMRWIEILMPSNIYSEIVSIFNNLSEQYITKINELQLYKKSYASSNLFKYSQMNNDEKIYVLYRYSQIKNIISICDIFSDDISYDIGSFHFELQLFLMKCKSIIIELFWNDNKDNKAITNLMNMLLENNKCIPNDFYSINRKCRNNLHYSIYQSLLKNDCELLNIYQNIYLNNILELFDKEINLKFGFFYNLALNVACKCQNKM
ncbi:MAG: hypothetical protein RR359_05585 [Bacilli bacterium]